MMTEQEILTLIQKYQDGTCSSRESQLLENWYNSVASDKKTQVPFPDSLWVRKEATYTFITSRTQKIILWKRFMTVAASLLLVGTVVFFIADKFYVTDHNKPGVYANDVPAGSNKAILTLGNGRTIVLDHAKNGNLAKEQNTLIRKTADGQVVYEPGSGVGDKLSVNTIATPRGGQYTLTLSDGTLVVLNAASSLKYPTQFTGKERIVELTGEAYFQVAHNKSKPFRVRSKGQLVEVLGTQFNINAYPDETVTKTTLEQGSVRVNENTVLSPGQQSILFASGITAVNRVDVNDAIAWKNGLFVFEDEPLQSIMRKISRWYDVEISYAPGVDKNKLYWGSVSRYEHISKVLEGLELTKGIHFKIEGRRIMVMQ